MKTGPVDVLRGYLLSFAEVMCEFDAMPTKTSGYKTGTKGIAVGGLLIDVANSAQNYSKGQSLYVVYDSKCMNCSINGTCARKVNHICIFSRRVLFAHIAHIHLNKTLFADFFNHISLISFSFISTVSF